jgi:endonuclease/exonuclease/phosphatase family metal-dependent hydrolase
MRFTLLTWNVLHQDFNDVIIQPNRQLNIFNKIKLYDADIVCLQEVDSSEIDTIYKSEFKDYHVIWQDSKDRVKKLKKWITETKENDDVKQKPNTIVCVTLVKKDKFDVVSHTPKSRLLITVIKSKETDQRIIISNVHLESGKNTNEIHIKHISSIIPMSDIICGDFNDFIGEPVFKYIEAREYRSAYSSDDKTPQFTMFDIKNDRKTIIDHIYVNKQFIINAIKWENECGPSDHIPIFAEIELIT